MDCTKCAHYCDNIEAFGYHCLDGHHGCEWIGNKNWVMTSQDQKTFAYPKFGKEKCIGWERGE